MEFIKNTLRCPFLLIKDENSDKINHYTGAILKCKNLSEGENFSHGIKSALVLPFSTITEKYPDIDLKSESGILLMQIDKEEILSIAVFEEYEKEFCKISDQKINQTDDEFKNSVNAVINKEICNGEGSNFTIARKYTGKIEDFNLEKAIGLFARLIKNEIGSYQTFCFFSGEFFIIGASPECHINIDQDKVRMQPISGTYKKKHNAHLPEIKTELIDFLSDKKEINELFMTLDEELKMMTRICSSGGKIIGPRVREMKNVLHTEYLLTGKSNMKIFEIIKESMHAATVVGSPLKNAVKIGSKYNNFDRKYYGGLIGIVDQKSNKFDSSIVIRSIQIDNNGNFEVCAGASIVKDSVPENELLEINAKLKSMMNNLTGKVSQNSRKLMDFLQFDHDIVENLYRRNQNLSHFLFFDKSSDHFNQATFQNKTAIIIDNEDDFVNMIEHMLIKIGFKTKIISYKDFSIKDDADLIIIGPGPGNPNNLSDEKIAKLSSITKNLIEKNRKTLGICLGHQMICREIGFKVKGDEKSTQGEQKLINLYKKDEFVGMYNTFYGKYNPKLSDNLKVSCDKKTNDIYAIRGKNFSSMQFHPESLFTKNGMEILFQEIEKLL